MARMTDAQLLTQIEHLEKQALGYYTGEIAQEQAKALDYYYGRPFGTEEEGRSRVVSTDVWDVVEGLTPLVVKPFVATEDAVTFHPVGKEDEEAAKQESDYINWVVTQRNDSFTELVNWVKTGLLQKNGVVKYWWEKSKRADIERYYGVSDDILTMMTQEPGVEVIEQSTYQAIGPDGMPAVSHDVTLRVTEEIGQARYCVIPPEEFLISRDAGVPNPKVARFVQHRRMVTLGDLRAMGYDVPDDLNDQSDTTEFAQQKQSRSFEEELEDQDEGTDPSVREVMYRETYIMIDKDGDGIPELRKVCAVGKEILADEETEEIPFAAWTPYQQPFKFYGRCPADEAEEIQLIKSTLLRQSLDNIYTINNNRVYVGGKVNLDDLIDNQIAGVVRVDAPDVRSQVFPAEVTPITQVVQPMIEYLDSAKENRTGFTRYNQGMDATSLNKTATGVRLITEAGNQRVELIARQFANGLADLMRGIHGLCRRHATKGETIRLRGKWVEIDPRGWKKRTDMTVSVGLGMADQQMKLQGLQLLMQEQKALAQGGTNLVSPENFLNAALKLAEALGFKAPEMFFSAPKPQEGLPPEVQGVLQQAQQEMQALQQENQQLKSGIAAKQIDADVKMRIAAMEQQASERDRQFQSFIQQMKDDAAYDRSELAGAIALIKEKMAPPPALAADVAEDIAEDGGLEDGQA